MSLDPTLRDALLAVPTAGIARALARRGLASCALSGLRARTGAGAAGPAFTLRFIPARGEPAVSLAEAIEAVPEGAMVVADTGGAREALPFAGLLAARLAERRAAGLITDGIVSGPGVLPVWQGLPAHAQGHGLMLAGFNEPVACGGAAVHPGDIVAGDREGVTVCPPDLAEEIALEAVEQQRLDIWLQREVESGRSLSGLLPPDAAALARFEAETKL